MLKFLRARIAGALRTAGDGQGRPSPALLLGLVFLLMTTAYAAPPALPAKPAGRMMTPPPAYEAPPTPEEVEAARGLEQMLLDLMVQEMRKSVPENELVPVTQAERIFQQMLDQEHTRMLSEQGTLGVAELVLAQMRGKR